MAKYKIIPSSRTIVHSPISIGHKAEKGVEAIEFDLTAWVETYGSGTLTVIMRRWGDAIPYPIALEIDENNKATWTLSDIDTAKAGMAYAQLNYIVGDEVVKKSDIYTFRVMDSLTGEGEPPEAYESWLEHLTHLAAEAMAEVLDIESIVTDKTLTVDGGIADGKATGDALALKADKSTTYTKSEVDQMIEDVEVETDTTLAIAGAPADAKTVGDELTEIKADLDAVSETISSIGLSDDFKNALLACFEAVGWKDDESAELCLFNLEDAMNTEGGGGGGGDTPADFYNRYEWSLEDEELSIIGGPSTVDANTGDIWINVNSMTSKRKVVTASKGRKSYISYTSKQPLNRYPIPIPMRAVSCTISATVANYMIIAEVYQYDRTEDTYTRIAYKGATLNPVSLTFNSGQDKFISVVLLIAGDAEFADGEPSAVSIVFTKEG